MRRLLNLWPKTGIGRLCRWRAGGGAPSGAPPIDPTTLNPNLWIDVNDSEIKQYWDSITSIAKGDTTITNTTAGSFSVTLPSAGTSKVTLHAWAAGESGVGDDAVSQGGAGGGGGAYGTSANVSVTASAVLAGKVGAGGAATSSGQQPNAGGSTSMTLGSTTYSVPGGSGTLGGLFSNAVGFASGFSGGDGGGATSTGGGGGGGSAGTGADGNAGALSNSSTGGAGGAAVTGGGKGGTGGDNGAAGAAGAQPGGGGGGGGFGKGGGAGGDGQTSITFANTGITIESSVMQTRLVVGDTFTIYGNSVGGYNTTGTVTFNNGTLIGSTAYVSATGASGSIKALSVTVSDGIGFVSDISGNSNHLKQATAAERMLMRPTGISSVSGADGLDLTTGFSTMSNCTIISLVRRTESAATIWQNNAGDGSIAITKAGAIQVITSSSTTTTNGTIPVNQDSVVAVRLAAGQVFVHTGSFTHNASASGTLTINRLNGNSAAFGYSIKAGLLWNTALTNAQIAGVSAFLAQQYGIGSRQNYQGTPYGLSATVNDDTVTLTWKSPGNPTTFHIERKTDGEYAEVDTVAGTVFTYDDEGLDADEYTYRVRASSPLGYSDYSGEYSAEVAAPVADFSGSPTSGEAPLVVQFTDLSANTATSWLWEKDSGGGFASFDGTPTAQNPSETFSAGTYAIRLTATNSSGSDSETKTSYITATDPE